MITILKKASLILSVFAVVAFLTIVFAAFKDIYEKDTEAESGDSTETETPEDNETPDNDNDDYSGLIDADDYDPAGRFLIAGVLEETQGYVLADFIFHNGYYYYFLKYMSTESEKYYIRSDTDESKLPVVTSVPAGTVYYIRNF